MTCPRCQVENDASARFCEDCGARLEAACPSCGTPVTPGKKFCRSCGAALTPEPSRFTSPASYVPKHLAEKILTSNEGVGMSIAALARLATCPGAGGATAPLSRRGSVEGMPSRRAAMHNDDAQVACLPTCVDADHPPRDAPMLAGEHMLAKRERREVRATV